MRSPGTTDAALFRARFGAPPTHHVHAPGRVNLIGDHVDYVGLPVLPVALSRRVSLLVRPRGDALVRVASVTPDFGERAFAVAFQSHRRPSFL
ncbi:MAG: galactokinase family protein, partial [Gemmatimonadota bacterium]